MTTDIYLLYVLLTSDHANVYCLSTDKSQIVLPIHKLTNTRYLHDEARYILRKSFDKEAFKFNEECNPNYLDIQNDLAINYVTSNNIQFDIDKDLIIMYGGMLLKNNPSDNYYWHTLKYDMQYKGYCSNINTNLIIDYVIHNTAI